MTYTVSTVYRSDDGRITTSTIGTYTNKVKAMKLAKRQASDAKDCVTYGPTSLAYVGTHITAVVAW